MINSFAILLLKMPTSFREVSEMALYSFALIWAQKINNNNGHLSTFVKKTSIKKFEFQPFISGSIFYNL